MDSLQVHLDGGPAAAGAARAALRDAGVVDGLPEDVRSDVELLVSEVVTNSVRHAGTDDVVLGVQRDDGRVRVRCCDGGPGFTGARRAPSHRGDGGFGLMLVDRLAKRWGIDRREPGPGCCVWFEVAA
jgi:anti-sigma regulatory factor (Ser/Thr protein kinase)